MYNEKERVESASVGSDIRHSYAPYIMDTIKGLQETSREIKDRTGQISGKSYPREDSGEKQQEPENYFEQLSHEMNVLRCLLNDIAEDVSRVL